MDNSSYRSRYIQERVAAGSLTGKTVVELQRTFERISQAEEKLGKRIEDHLTREDFVLLFENFRITKVYSFRNTKSILRKYLEWARDSGLADPNIPALAGVKYSDLRLYDALDQKFFKDFQSLQDKIDDTLWAAEKVDDMVFATQIAAIYLAWCGIKMADAVLLKKSDVAEDHISFGDKKIYPNDTIMQFLKDYRDAVSYQSQAKQVITLKYVPSEYLLRTVRSGQLTPKLLIFLLAKFSKSGANQDTQSVDDRFAYFKIYWSGIFHRTYLYECANGTIRKGDIETISSLFGEHYPSTAQANLRLSDYKAFKEHFFPAT